MPYEDTIVLDGPNFGEDSETFKTIRDATKARALVGASSYNRESGIPFDLLPKIFGHVKTSANRESLGPYRGSDALGLLGRTNVGVHGTVLPHVSETAMAARALERRIAGSGLASSKMADWADEEDEEYALLKQAVDAFKSVTGIENKAQAKQAVYDAYKQVVHADVTGELSNDEYYGGLSPNKLMQSVGLEPGVHYVPKRTYSLDSPTPRSSELRSAAIYDGTRSPPAGPGMLKGDGMAGGQYCKVVKREGEWGARIHPKNCKVRYALQQTGTDAQGNPVWADAAHPVAATPDEDNLQTDTPEAQEDDAYFARHGDTTGMAQANKVMGVADRLERRHILERGRPFADRIRGRRLVEGDGLASRKTRGTRMAQHAKHHSRKHMAVMDSAMSQGHSFGAAHKIAMRQVGKGYV